MTTEQVHVGGVVRPPKTAELIARRLRTQIVRGELAAGDSLPSESELVHRFEVSRPTLREAFRILEAESLIRIRRGSRGGAQVLVPELAVASNHVGLLLQMSHTTLTDVYVARTVLETACAAMLAQRRDSRAVAELRAVIAQLHHLVENGSHNRGAWAGAAMSFHAVVVRTSGNNTLAVQGAMLHDIAARHLSAYVAARPDNDPAARARFRILVRSFTRLADLVAAGDSAGAGRHWRVHMEAVSKALLDDLGSTTVLELFR